MIELAGVRFAVGRPTARAARGAVCLLALSYAAGAVHQVGTAAGVLPPVIASIAGNVFVITYAAAVFAVYPVALAVLNVESQPVTPVPATASRAVRWWSSTALRCLTIPGVWLGLATAAAWRATVVVLGGASTGPVPHAALVSASCAVAAIMACHAYWAWRMVRAMSRTAALGAGAPYFGFDWDRFDSSKEGQFRRRFPGHQWPFPGGIAVVPEAGRYAELARAHRLRLQFGALTVALVALALAQHTLIAAVVTMGRNLIHLTEPPVPLSSGVWGWVGLGAALGLWMVPLGLQHRANEMEALATIYEDRREELLDEAATPAATRRRVPLPWRLAGRGAGLAMRRDAGRQARARGACRPGWVGRNTAAGALPRMRG